MKLYDICRGADVECPEHIADIEISGISCDSRRIKSSYLFICLTGDKNDGHHHIDEALINGASAVVIENEVYFSDKAVLVESTRTAYAKMMNSFCENPAQKLKFIGITGTNGKTSVSVMLKHILNNANIPCEVIGTLNSSSLSESAYNLKANFTTPDPEELYPMLQRILASGIEYVVMEVSSHALKYDKLAPINFEIGVFTNLTEDHLDFHGTMEDYFKSKKRLFDKCSLGIINVDDEYGKQIAELAPCKIKTCSAKQSADYSCEVIENLGENGTRYRMEADEDDLLINCSIPGCFSVLNSMQASACALELNIDKPIICESFDSFQGVDGRFERLEAPRGWDVAVFIDYAHTPDALQNLLDTANSLKREGQRVVLLFGCGGDREHQKRSIMGKIAVENADFVIITSDNPRSECRNDIINDILQSITCENNFAVIPDRKTAIEFAISCSRTGDIILLAGKGHERYEIDSEGRKPFDERKIVCEAFEKYERKNQGGNEL